MRDKKEHGRSAYLLLCSFLLDKKIRDNAAKIYFYQDKQRQMDFLHTMDKKTQKNFAKLHVQITKICYYFN
ncbi:hypothetical protein D1B32_18115 [Oceanobacillus profundus]|uniref:Uncharacterized protein n=1 Tax=Oceanobacillus profundus TaxID=372463 RepID=A0A417YC15_9BACI|nr:hypothetical protein CHI07_18725 [Paenibacillus sp. 7884-2]RHW30229.1 hypothetical protein D1B32_18115 [Oceanobacillus profundus]